MPTLQSFRSYQIAEDARGSSLELWRGEKEVICLAVDPRRSQFVELRVLAGVDTSVPESRPVQEYFRTEAQALMRLNHRNLVEVREFGEDEGALFYVTEFLDGEPLDTFLARCNPLPAWLVLEMAAQITQGLLVLKNEPLLLSRVDLFNARLLLEGETTSELVVKLSEFGFGEGAPAQDDGRAVERRVVRDLGRLLIYALTGLVSDSIPAGRNLSSLVLSTPLAQLLASLLDPVGKNTLTSMEQVAASLERCRKEPEFGSRPERLPVTLRPRLPLQAQFLTLRDLGELLGDSCRLERTAFDAMQPYCQRAFMGGRAVMTQLLPPARVMPRLFLPALREAAARVSPEGQPNLVRVLQPPPDDAAGWFIEEAPPRLTLDAAMRLRKRLSPTEAAMVLNEIEKGVAQAEALKLVPAALATQQIFLEFTHTDDSRKLPTDDELGRTPLDAWPPFRLRLRAHPVCLNFTQPNRFRRERLLGLGPKLGEASPGLDGLRVPEAADYGALAISLLGGESVLAGPAGALVQQALEGGGMPRQAFLEELTGLLAPRVAAANKAQAAAAAATAKAREVREAREAKEKETKARQAAKAEEAARAAESARVAESTRATAAGAAAKKAAAKRTAPLPEPPAPPQQPALEKKLVPKPETRAIERPPAAKKKGAAGKTAPIPVEPEPPTLRDETRTVEPATGPLDFSALMGGGHAAPEHEEETGGEGGFAEVLFSRRDHATHEPEPDESWREDGPLPFALTEVPPDEFERHPLHFDRPGLAPEPALSPWKLILLMVIVAAFVAAVAAHLTGMAPWVHK